jgi:hypothetical protein
VTIRSERGKLQAFYVFATKWGYLEIAVPFCSECAEWRERWEKQDATLVVIAAVAALTVAGFVAFPLDASPWVFWAIFFSLAVIFKVSVDWFVHDSRAIRLRDYDHDTTTFAFKHRDYAQEFERLNLQG